MSLTQAIRRVREFFERIGLLRPYTIHYIGGSETLPAPLPRETEAEMIALLTEGSPEARKTLIEHNLRLVVFIARRFETPNAGLEDLISIGTIGLIKAVNTFCADKNIKLTTYASRCIENEILMFLRKASNRRTNISLDESLSSDWDGNELLLSDVLGTDPDIVQAELYEDADRQVLYDAVMRLPERERDVVLLRFGLFGKEELTQKEVADKLGISQSYISRIEKKIMAKLKRELAAML
ncbi:MAG: sigma-70 family RNA polymerase sigma factor [Oscillospiraceae bacterium]|jgi:RNA polymerase sporulation-specific sigma factor|nr:sigma-70 family RNA polymerase sigma factor [Oscillospiraceae bacterium]